MRVCGRCRPFQHRSNTQRRGAKALVRRLKPAVDGATKPGLPGGAARAPPQDRRVAAEAAAARMDASKRGSRVPWLVALLPTGAALVLLALPTPAAAARRGGGNNPAPTTTTTTAPPSTTTTTAPAAAPSQPAQSPSQPAPAGPGPTAAPPPPAPGPAPSGSGQTA